MWFRKEAISIAYIARKARNADAEAVASYLENLAQTVIEVDYINQWMFYIDETVF